MDAADFDYELPAAAIAQVPIEPRDAARLLVDRGPRSRPSTGLSPTSPSCVGPGDVLVVNDTRVLPARLQMRKATGGAVEVLAARATAPTGHGRRWCRPSRRVATGHAS